MPDPEFAPIELTLYDETGEAKKTYSRSRVPWGILKKAIRLSKLDVKADKISEQDVDAIAGLVVEVFGNQFSLEELDAGADVSEMFTVVQAITTRAAAIVQANPTVPPTGKTRKPA